eukprot:Phypoly_transcript_13749.p1 GENE.Phypoly_transcript_13749~~Phypoly_transcript_13749.p1  ORF type:complete len:138 (+),score=11.45 Phypoly_transcript_13749:375-788(+)
MLGEFQCKVNQKNAQGEARNTKFHFFPQTLEDYQHTFGKVNLILMIQSLYYMPNRREMIEKTMKMGDELIFMLMGPKSGMHRMQIALIPESQRTYKTVNSSDICALFSSMNYQCTHLGTIQPTLRVDNPTTGMVRRI